MTDHDEPDSIQLMQRMVDMSAQRTEMSAERTYMNAERTLSVWVRTALALMISGIAFDRFGFALQKKSGQFGFAGMHSNTVSNWTGAALVAMGVLMAVTTGVRFMAYISQYKRHHRPPFHHGPFLAPFFALVTALFGAGLLVFMLAVIH